MLDYHYSLPGAPTGTATGAVVVSDVEYEVNLASVSGLASRLGSLHKPSPLYGNAPDHHLRIKGYLPIPIGDDERELGYEAVKLLNAGNGQFVTIGQLLTYWTKADWEAQQPSYGTATLINRRHILTAAHNIAKITKQGDAIRAYRCVFSAALNGHRESTLVEAADVVSAYTSFDTDNFFIEPSQSNDHCLLVLNKNIGDYVGWSGVAAVLPNLEPLKGELQIAGYPFTKADEEYNGTNLFVERNQLHDLTDSKKIISYVTDCSEGQSGAALVWHPNGLSTRGILVGIHITGIDNTHNIGVTITNPLMSAIRRVLLAS